MFEQGNLVELEILVFNKAPLHKPIFLVGGKVLVQYVCT
jgi:hypothetical protein